MPSSHSLSQVEDRLATVLDGYAPLSAQTVITSDTLEVAIEDDQFPALVIFTSAYGFDIADENGQAIHTAEIHVEAVNSLPATGSISRANRDALGHVVAAIAADRTLGIGLQDIQEQDIAPVEPRGKDVDSASLRFQVQWFTPLGDHFTIATPHN
ncbi:MAG: hypothetical protein IPG83_02435 [Novosphingobium sp.]|jgi:hypothetical protein|nr:hypothetical protein [Novosphingobium sp.]